MRRPWDPADLAGGPIDDIFTQLRAAFSELRVERLSASRPADDDNVWFISIGGDQSSEIQLDSMPNGYPPFLIESNHARERADETELVVQILSSWLRD